MYELGFVPTRGKFRASLITTFYVHGHVPSTSNRPSKRRRITNFSSDCVRGIFWFVIHRSPMHLTLSQSQPHHNLIVHLNPAPPLPAICNVPVELHHPCITLRVKPEYKGPTDEGLGSSEKSEYSRDHPHRLFSMSFIVHMLQLWLISNPYILFHMF